MRKIFIMVLGVLCVICVSFSHAAEPVTDNVEKQAEAAEESKSSSKGELPLPEMMSIDCEDKPITNFIKLISERIDKNFIFDEKITRSGNITIISPEPIPIKEAYKVFLSTLEMKGFSVIDTGSVVKIVKKQDAKVGGTELRVGANELASMDNIITQLIPLKNVSAASLLNGIRPMVSRDGLLSSFDATNMLMVIDTAANIERIVNITNALDIPGDKMAYEVIQVKYADATDLVREMTTIFSGNTRRSAAPGKPPTAATRIPFKMMADARTNSIIIFSAEYTLDEVKRVIKKLDIDIPEGQSRINVYYMKYASAEEVSKVLTKFSAESKRRVPGKPNKKPKFPPGKRPSATRTNEIQSGKLQIEGDVTITADKATNSLIILASPSDYEILLGVIEKLDIMRPQVFVEAFILEITLEKERELGIEWRSTSDFTKNKVNVIGGTNFGNINSVSTNPLAAPSGLMIGSVKGTMTFAGKEFLNIGALLRALETESGINVMSRPHILTMNNEEAEISVVENVPFKTSEKYDTYGNPIYSYDYKDVGVVLKLTPQVMENDFVKMSIDQEISQVMKSSQGVEVTALTTSKRTAKTTIFVKDNEMVVIGGLIKDNELTSESKVPCLGDMPFFGALFRATSVRNQKTDLLVFITPHVIEAKDYYQLNGITSEKKEELKKFKKTNKFDEFKEFDEELVDEAK